MNFTIINTTNTFTRSIFLDDPTNPPHFAFCSAIFTNLSFLPCIGLHFNVAYRNRVTFKCIYNTNSVTISELLDDYTMCVAVSPL